MNSIDEEITLTPGERLIAMMLCDVIDGQKIKTEFDTKLIRTALSDGYDWALAWKYPGTFPHRRGDGPIRQETIDILDMWDAIEWSIESMDEKDKARLAQVEGGRGTRGFPGFDANHDPHYAMASFLINDMHHHQRFKGRELNSHGAPPIDSHRRMYAAFDRVREHDLGHGNPLTVDRVIELLNAGLHPDRARNPGEGA